MRRVNLTVRYLESLRGSPSGQIDYWDNSFRRFGVRVTPSGQKTWTVVYRHNGRVRRYTLGTFPPVSLARARELAEDALNRVRDGHDPAEEHQLARREGTFGELASEYLERHAKIKKKSWRNDQWIINRHLLPRWEHVKAQDITDLDAQGLIDSIADRGTPILANRTVAVARKMFNVAIKRRWKISNPFRGMELPGKEKRRDRVLSEDEIKKVWNALESEDPFIRALFQLRLLTAQRGGEIRHMRWEDIDLVLGWWNLPREFSKNDIGQRVPLNQQAVEILQTLRTWQQERLDAINAGRRKKKWKPKDFSAWVFPSPRGDDSPFDWEQRATARIRKASDVEFRPHDLRRTVATLLTAHGYADRFLLKRILNHVDSDITAVYDRNTYDTPKRLALDAWGRRLKAIVEGKESTATVVPISAGQK